MFKRILLALDGSDHSRQALPAAIEVARKFESSLSVIHVVEHDRGHSVVFTDETPAGATKLVYEAVARAREAGITADGEVHDVAVGHVARAIVEAARSRETDLIVMGSRGLSDVQGLLLGSVTHKVMQLSHTAVLVARAAEDEKQAALVSAARQAAPA